MADEASRAKIEDLVRAWLDETDGVVNRPSDAFAQRGARTWRMWVLLRLLAYEVPDARIAGVLGCRREDAETAIAAVRRRLPDADSVRAFLQSHGDGDLENAASSGPAADVEVSETAEVALETLHYWTDMWFDEGDGDSERARGERELS